MKTGVIVTGHPGLVIPPRRKPDVTNRLGIQGIVKSVELIDSRTGLIKRKLGPFPNLITNAGLNAIGNGTKISDLTAYVSVGTDNTPPDVTDVALGAKVDTGYNDDGGYDDVYTAGPSYAYWTGTRTREIPEAYGNGNLTELGFFVDAGVGTMWMRALFLDGEGSPTTVTKTDNEKLRIVYEWRVYLTLIPTTDVLTINAVSTDCENRALRGNNTDAWGLWGILAYLGYWSTNEIRASAYENPGGTWPTIDGGGFGGSSALATSLTNVAYGSGDFYRDQDLVWDPGVANWGGGIGALTVPFNGFYTYGKHALGVKFDPHVAKINTQRFTFRCRTAFGRH